MLALDVNTDGYEDLITVNVGQNFLLIKDKKGDFIDETYQLLPYFDDTTQDIEAEGIDRDGNIDLIVGNEGNNHLLLNNGKDMFEDAPDQQLPLESGLEEARQADLSDNMAMTI